MNSWGNWAKQQLANVAGTAEPIYGPDALQSVARQTEKTSYTELTRDDLKWATIDSTCVETQCFYIMSDEGKLGMAQVIYSNVAGIKITVQFNSKIWYMDGKTPNLWCSDPLENHGFDESKHSFYADNCAVDLSEDGKTYTIKSLTNQNCIVDLKITRTAPGFQVGENGTSTFGTDPAAPWGKMRHCFWARCKSEGKMIIKSGEVNFNGRAMFVMALQGMKPHHAAAKWNFIDFQSPAYSAVMMEYTTPASYGTSVVNVGGIVTDDKILFAGAENTAKHMEVKGDPENDWPEPGAGSYHWKGKTSDGKEAAADLAGSLGDRLDRIDIMAQVPKFVKQIVAGTAGTKPYIYQYAPMLKLNVKIGDEVREEEGRLFTEATFIS